LFGPLALRERVRVRACGSKAGDFSGTAMAQSTANNFLLLRPIFSTMWRAGAIGARKSPADAEKRLTPISVISPYLWINTLLAIFTVWEIVWQEKVAMPCGHATIWTYAFLKVHSYSLIV
jgi:hypothetical protein